jgi:hypothetical protein
MSARFGRLLAVLVTVCVAATGTAQTPSNALPVPPGFAKFGASSPPAPAPNPGGSTIGQSWPHIGPDPAPHVGPQSRCPPGYFEPSTVIRVAHRVVCMAMQTNFVRSYNGMSISTTPYPNTSYPAKVVMGQPLSSVPPGPEHTTVNQCIGHPSGSYACGRGATECCGPTQDNMCFPGAFACRASVTDIGPKAACCISK